MTLRPIHILLLGCWVATSLWPPSIAKAQEAFTISSFDTTILVEKNADVLITETIIVDFGDNERHGILRVIPTSYKTNSGSKRSIRLSDISVDGDPFKLDSLFGKTTIKIGDPNILISGSQSYTIHYRVQNALNQFTDHTELYWNSTGNEWDTTIQNTSSTVTIAGRPADTQVRRVAYQGPNGSTELASAQYQNGTILFSSTRPLGEVEGLTVVVGWPLGFTELPSQFTKSVWFLTDNWPFLLPLLTLVGLFWIIKRYGQDPAGKGTIVPLFAAPKNVSLLESSVLRDEKFHDRDLTALIIDWAVAGYLHINEPKKGQYELEKRSDLGAGTTAEQAFFKALFKTGTKVKLADVRHDQALVKAKSALGEETSSSLVSKRYFSANPQNVRTIYIVVGIVLIPLSFITIGALGIAGIVGISLSGILIATSSFLMPRRTEAGVHKKEEILGFELYLKTAERYRMKFAEQEKIFERFLPYAIAFGVAGLWAKAFKDVATAAPSWYSGYYTSSWSTTNFVGGLNTNLSSNLSSITSASSGGSGFSGGGSGGGFGGGGGGSW